MNWPSRVIFRKPSSYWLAVASEFGSPLWRAYAHARRRVGEKPSDPATWRKALLIGANHIGDLLYRTASLPYLQEALPGCAFDIAAPWPAAEIIEGNPVLRRIQRIEILERSQDPDWETLRAERYDAAICYDCYPGWQILKTAVDLGIPNILALQPKGFSAWVTHQLPLHYPRPYPAYFRELVAVFGNRQPDWSLRPQVFISREDELAAEKAWVSFELKGSQPVMACFITSRQKAGVLPAEKFAETIRLVRQQSSVEIILCGAPDDKATLEAFNVTLGGNCHLNAGLLPLRALTALLRRCRAVLSTDSGPRHMANAAGVPVVFVRNLWFSKVEAGPYCDSEYDFAPDVERIGPDQQGPYLDQVKPEAMAAKLLELLKS